MARSGVATLDHFTALAAADGNATKDSQGRLQVDPELLNKVANDFEQAIWGQQPPSDNSSASRVATEALAATSLRQPRFEIDQRFDLNIHFGSSQKTKFQKTKIVGFNDVEPVAKEQVEVAVQTQLRIIDVALTGVEKTLDDSGRPILENYTWIARDVL